MTVLVTGGAGFIGSNFILEWFQNAGLSNEEIVNLDKLTYAGNQENLLDLSGNPKYIFVKGCIGDGRLISKMLDKYKPRAIINFAAESHVDRSISDPSAFIQTNVVGFSVMLHAAYLYWYGLEDSEKDEFRFLHVSTDEVYGSLSANEEPFTERSPYKPNSPYSASKASSDHLARSYFQTFGLPVLTTNCSNNYGAYQFPEKLIPLIIHNALGGKSLPVYGDGNQVRDWLFVKDHCSAIRAVLKNGKPGQVYNIGGYSEKRNIEVVELICSILDDMQPRNDKVSYREQIQYVVDRLGHDRRYAIDAGKVKREIQWEPSVAFDDGIIETVKWYLKNKEWVKQVLSNK